MIQNGGVSFWHADMGGIPAPRAPLPGDLTADICIIGAGFTGLWTAWYLAKARPDLDIVILEKDFAGFGASGRNGGWCSGEFGWSRARYLQNSTRTDVIAMERELRATVGRIGAVAQAEGIDCDWHPTDCLTFATNPAQWQRLQAEHAEAMAWEVPADRLSLIGPAEARARIGIAGAMGALVRHGVARIQPAKLVRGLAEAVARRGVRIFEGTTVTGISKGLVTTDRGRVRAGQVVRATEGFTHHIAGQAREWLPLNSAILVTEPLSEAQWAGIGWSGAELLGDGAHAYCYAQRTREGRIAMGGRGVPYRFGSGLDYRGETQAATIAQLTGILHRLLPQTQDLRLDHAWCGVLGVPRDWCASLGYDPDSGMAWAGGYVGLGVSTSHLAGETLADLLLGQETHRTRLPWVNRRPRKWEPEPLRWLGVHGMYRLYHMADRAEATSGQPRTSRLADLANRLTGR